MPGKCIESLCAELVCWAMQQLDGLHGLNGVQVQAPGQDAVNGQDADGSSDHEESSEELLHIHFSEKM